MSQRRPALHRLPAWFAIAILLLGALAPSISAAVSHARGDTTWQEICRSSASPRESDTQTDALDMLMAGHCAMCHLHAQDLALPPTLPPMPLRQGLSFAMPERVYSASVTAFAWRAAPARAPPSIV